MPQIACKCGERLRLGEIPNPIEWLLISDSDFDGMPEVLESDSLYNKMKSCLECPSCGRLWIFWKGFEDAPTEYISQKGDQIGEVP